MEPKVDNHIFPNLRLEWHYFFTFFSQTFQLNLMACIQESLEHLQKSLHKIVALSGKNLMLGNLTLKANMLTERNTFYVFQKHTFPHISHFFATTFKVPNLELQRRQVSFPSPIALLHIFSSFSTSRLIRTKQVVLTIIMRI